jgi:molybdopterin-guanine dinucleotide biosynthesis protein A
VAVEPAIDAALRRGERAVISFWREVRVHVLAEEVVRDIGDPWRIFWNVNRPRDLREAESRLSGSRRDDAGADDTPAATDRRANGT